MHVTRDKQCGIASHKDCLSCGAAKKHCLTTTTSCSLQNRTDTMPAPFSRTHTQVTPEDTFTPQRDAPIYKRRLQEVHLIRELNEGDVRRI